MAEPPPYTWTGTDGRRHVVTEVENRHLLYYFRLLQERGARLTHLPPNVSPRREVCNAILAVYDEIEKRGLQDTILPLRTQHEQQEAEARRRAWHEQVAVETGPEAPVAAGAGRPPAPDVPPHRPQRSEQRYQDAFKAQARDYRERLDLLKPAPPPGKRKIVIRKRDN